MPGAKRISITTLREIDSSELGKLFSRGIALLRIWLGPNPADWKLKEALLGKAA